MNPSDVSKNPSTSASTNAPGCGCDVGESQPGLGAAQSSASAGGAMQSNAGNSQDLKQRARETVDQLKTTATDAAARVRDQAAGMVDERKTQVADRIGAYGSAVHRSAESLEQDDPNIAWLTHQAADRINQVADYVRARDFQQLKHDAEDVARRHPAAFFGGMFVAGLVVGNLLKATQRTSTRSNSQFEDESYPRAENVPVADVPDRDPWPASPPSETF